MFTALKNWLSRWNKPAPRALAPGVKLAVVPPAAETLILSFEGLDQPWKRPPGASGVTLGHGFDLGYCTIKEFRDAWRPHLPPVWISRLDAVVGLRGKRAQMPSMGFLGMPPITPAMAAEVFARCTLPKWRAETARAFPGIAALPPNAQGALVSLTFNRGPGMSGPRRKEMRAVRDLVARSPMPAPALLDAIASQIESMQRLWPDVAGLRRRRRAEADMVRRALRH